MLSSEIDTYFLSHPLKERYFSFSDDERSGIAAVAGRDVRAAVASSLPENDEEKEFFNAAIAEQCIFLMLNPEYLTGCYTRVAAAGSAGETLRFSEQKSVLGQRAAALIAPLLNKKSGDDSGSQGGSGNDDDGGDKVDDSSTAVGIVRLQRG